MVSDTLASTLAPPGVLDKRADEIGLLVGDEVEIQKGNRLLYAVCSSLKPSITFCRVDETDQPACGFTRLVTTYFGYQSNTRQNHRLVRAIRKVSVSIEYRPQYRKLRQIILDYNSHPTQSCRDFQNVIIEGKCGNYFSSNPQKNLLHEAASVGATGICAILLKKTDPVVNIGINSLGPHSYTALHYACYNGHLETVKVLLDSGSNVTIKNDHGETPIESLFQNSTVPRKVARQIRYHMERVKTLS